MEYRRRQTPRHAKAFANSVLDLYLLCKPKISKISARDRNRIKPMLEGIDDFLAEVPDEPDIKQWAKYFDATIELVEAIGVTKITLPTTREGYEMLEGTVY